MCCAALTWLSMRITRRAAGPEDEEAALGALALALALSLPPLLPLLLLLLDEEEDEEDEEDEEAARLRAAAGAGRSRGGSVCARSLRTLTRQMPTPQSRQPPAPAP